MRKVLWVLVIMVAWAMCIAAEAARVTTGPRAAKPVAKQAPAPKPMGALILPQTEAQKKEFAQWQQVYGFNENSHIYYNLALLVKIADQHGQMINSGNKYIDVIFDSTDPNSLASLVVAHDNAIKKLMEENAELKKQLAEFRYVINGTIGTINESIAELGKAVRGFEKQPSIVADPNVVIDPNEQGLKMSRLVYNCQICKGDKSLLRNEF